MQKAKNVQFVVRFGDAELHHLSSDSRRQKSRIIDDQNTSSASDATNDPSSFSAGPGLKADFCDEVNEAADNGWMGGSGGALAVRSD